MDISFEIHGNDERTEVFHTCDSCGYRSRYRQNLKRHRRTRHADQDVSKLNKVDSYLCDQCGQTYKTKYGLILHLKSFHNKVFKYQCKLCKRGFNQLHSYKGHIASHEDVLKVKCNVCKATFQYQTSLRNHQKSVHNSMNIHCDVAGCETQFSTLNAFHEHTQAKHNGRILVCNICGKSYKWRSSLKHHKDNKHADK